MSQGQRRYIPSWLRGMRGWEEAPEWLLDKIEEEQGFSFLELGITPEAAGFEIDAAPTQKDSDEPVPEGSGDLREAYERERQGSSHQLSADQPTRIASEAAPAEREQDAEEPSLAQEQSEIADWLIRLEEEASSEVETPTAPEAAATGTEDLPEPDAEEGVPRRRSGITDWLVHLEEEPPESGLENAATGTPDEDTDTADWLAGLEAAEPVSDDAAPDWLPDLEDKTGTEEEERFAGQEADTPAWLAELQGEGTGEDVPEWLADLDSGSGISEWLAEQKEAEAAPQAPGTPQPKEEAADALTDLEQGIEDEGDAGQQPATGQAADSTQIDKEAGNGASDLDLDIEDEDAASWLHDLDEGSDEQPPATDQAADSPQIDKETGNRAADLELDIEDEDTADWLHELNEGVAEQLPAADQVVGSGQGNEEGIRDDQMPAWLRDVDALIDEQPAELDQAPTVVQPEVELDRNTGEREEDLVLGEDAGAGEVPDWLHDLAAGEDEPEPGASPAASSLQPDVGLEREAGEREEDLVLGEDAGADEVPDWLHDLAVDEDEPEPSASPAASSPQPDVELEREAGEREEDLVLGKDTGADEVPDWLHDLAVGEDEPEPGALLETDAAQPDAELDRDTGGREESLILDEESGENEVPDWLRDLAVSEDRPATDSLAEAGASVPDWLPFSEEPPASSTVEEEAEPLDEPSSGPPAWMQEIYTSQHEVPPDQEVLSLPPTEELEGKETLDWLSSLQDKGARSSQESTVESSGPLAGLGGVLSPEPILAIHPKSAFQPVPPVPDAHQAEAELVVRTLEMPTSRQVRVSGSPGREILNSLGRWAIYGLLIATVLIAPLRSLVRLPDFAETHTFYNTIEELQPGDTVLLVFDYDASLDGTLTPQARAIIWHLQHRELGIVLLSLTPQGTSIAADLVAEREGLVPGRDYIDLGYLPPHPASLLAFMENPIGGAAGRGTTGDPAQTMLGQRLQTFSGLDMIVTVSGDQEHIRWWIEQVQTRTPITLLAAVPAGIMPYLAPYYGELGTGQVAGILGGLGPTAQYEELTGADFVPSARVSYVVQTNALILFTGVVLVSGVGSLLTARQRRDTARQPHPSPSGAAR